MRRHIVVVLAVWRLPPWLLRRAGGPGRVARETRALAARRSGGGPADLLTRLSRLSSVRPSASRSWWSTGRVRVATSRSSKQPARRQTLHDHHGWRRLASTRVSTRRSASIR